MEKRNISEENVQEGDVIRLWEWALHEDNLFISRGNFFLVAESMLFAAFATLAVNEEVNPVYILIFGIVGILSSAVWIYLAWAQIYLTMKPLKSRLRDLSPDYSGVTKKRGKYPSTHFVLGVLFPSALLITWVSLVLLTV